MKDKIKSLTVRCRLEVDLKNQATEILNASGFTISEALRLFLQKVVTTGGLPFEVRAALSSGSRPESTGAQNRPAPSLKTARALAQAHVIRERFAQADSKQ